MASADEISAFDTALNNLEVAAAADLASGSTTIQKYSYANLVALAAAIDFVWEGELGQRARDQVIGIET